MSDVRNKKRTRVTVRHRAGCAAKYAVRGRHWPHPWSTVPKGFTFGGASDPLNRGHTVWAEFVCNDTLCPGKLAVSMEHVFELLGERKELRHG